MTRIFKNCAAFRTAIPFYHFLRLSCSDDPGFFDESEAMVQFSEKRGYPVSVSQAGHHRAQQTDRQLALHTALKEDTDRIPFTVTFHPHKHVVKS